MENIVTYKNIAIYLKIRYFFSDTIRYDISIVKKIYGYFRYIKSSVVQSDISDRK